MKVHECHKNSCERDPQNDVPTTIGVDGCLFNPQARWAITSLKSLPRCGGLQPGSHRSRPSRSISFLPGILGESPAGIKTSSEYLVTCNRGSARLDVACRGLKQKRSEGFSERFRSSRHCHPSLPGSRHDGIFTGICRGDQLRERAIELIPGSDYDAGFFHFQLAIQQDFCPEFVEECFA